jgi:hypothetical protein
MDQAEADYLRQQIRELHQANRRWKGLAVITLCVLALFVFAGGATLFTGGMVMGRQMREEALRAREAEMVARDQAEQARMVAEQARVQAEQALEAERRAQLRAREAEPAKP